MFENTTENMSNTLFNTMTSNTTTENNLKKVKLATRRNHKASPRIPRETINQGNYYHSLIEQAQNGAKQIVRKAYQESDQIYSHAFLSGFEAGISITIQDLVDYLGNSEQMAKKLLTQTYHQLTQLLSAFFNDDEVICRLLEKLRIELYTTPSDNDKLTLVLPVKYKALRSRLLNIFSIVDIKTEIKFTSSSTAITLEHDKIIWSCDPPSVIEKLSNNTFNELLKQHNIYESCQLTTLHSLQGLKEALDQHCQQISNSHASKTNV